MTQQLATVVAFFILAGFVPPCAAQPKFSFHFDPATANGVKGVIQFQYPRYNSSFATVSAALDFSRVNQTKIRAFDKMCVKPVFEYEWHIHVDWSSQSRSASFQQCSLLATGNHYDPLFACSPNSEHVNMPECKIKSTRYACSPKRYTKDFRVCEKGDLSGKFGNLVLDATMKTNGKWTDKHFPLPSENRPNWSIVLHAVCGKHTTRMACAVEEKRN